MPLHGRSIMLAPITAVLAVSLACSDHSKGPARVAVSGTVTHQGRPLSKGLLTFRPAAGTAGPAAGTRVQDGRYSIPAASGPVPGRYTVQLQLVDPHVPRRSSREGGTARAMKSPPLVSLQFDVEIREDTNELNFTAPQ
jgi:hypothetical protein